MLVGYGVGHRVECLAVQVLARVIVFIVLFVTVPKLYKRGCRPFLLSLMGFVRCCIPCFLPRLLVVVCPLLCNTPLMLPPQT
jgi:hypothetical protein